MKRNYGQPHTTEEAEGDASTPLDYHCGVCGSELKDSDALLTSCGHFFCANQECTVLVPGVSGVCEQCGRQCDAGTLTNRAAGYDDHVKSFVFGDPVTDIKKSVEILEFRERHTNILRENLKRIQEENSALKSTVKQLESEIVISKSENQALKKQLARLRHPGIGGGTTSRAEPHDSGYSAKFDIGRSSRASVPGSFHLPRASSNVVESAYKTSRTTGSRYTGQSCFTTNLQGLSSRTARRHTGADKAVRKSSTLSRSRPNELSHSKKNGRISLPSSASVVNQISRFASSSRNTPLPSVTPEELSRAAKRRRSLANPLSSRR